jgi:AcrR family transcriptional regulator
MVSQRVPARERLLAAADRLFYAEGIRSVGIDRVIGEAGVAKGSLFYNFASKEGLVAAYLATWDERRREQIVRHQREVDDPVDKMLALFGGLQEAVTEPGFRGCPFANASAESPAGGVEADALRRFRAWLREMVLDLATQADYLDPGAVADRLLLLHDGAMANAQLDRRPDAVGVATELARGVLREAPRGHTT